MSSSSLMAANSAPVMARPSIPSSFPIAAAVVAWSPVIMRTRMPALLHSAIAAFASGLGGSTMPTIASSVRSWTRLRRSPPGSNVAGSKSRWATTMTRSPAAAMRSLASRARWRLSSVTCCERPVRVPVRPSARDQDVGRALDVAAHDRSAVLPDHLVERRHELVLGVERHLRDPGIGGSRLVDVEAALGPEHDQGALGRVADQAVPVEHRVGAQDHREQVGVEVEVRPAHVLDLTLRCCSPRR